MQLIDNEKWLSNENSFNQFQSFSRLDSGGTLYFRSVRITVYVCIDRKELIG